MSSGLAIAMLSVSQNAQSRPASNASRSTVASINRAAPEQGVKEGARLFYLPRPCSASGAERKAIFIPAKAKEALLGARFLDIQLDKNAIAGGVGEDL